MGIDPRSEVEYGLRLRSKYREKLGKHHRKESRGLGSGRESSVFTAAYKYAQLSTTAFS